MVFDDWVGNTSFGSSVKLIVLLVNVRHHKNCVVVHLYLHLGSLIDSFFGVFVLLETHKSSSCLGLVELSGLDFTERLEQIFQLLQRKSFSWEILNVQIGELITLVFSLSLLGVDHHIDGLIAKLGIVQFLDCFFSSILCLKLDITESSAFTVGINFEFAGLNGSELFEEVVEFLLVSLFREISDQNVGLVIEATGIVLLSVEHNASVVNCCIVHFTQASISLLLGIEVKITKAFRSLGLLVEHDSNACDFVTLGVKELKQVKVECLI